MKSTPFLPAWLGASVFFVQCVNAATFTVTTSASSGVGSFREAVAQAVLTPASETAEIVFDNAHFNQPRTIAITAALVDINRSLTISGPPVINGHPALTLTGDTNADGIADVDGLIFVASPPTIPSWEIRRIAFQRFTSPAVGSAVRALNANLGTLVIEACTFADNKATGEGGAIYFGTGSLTINRSLFMRNASLASGAGAIAVQTNTVLNCNRSVFRDNVAFGTGGAIDGVTMTVENTWFDGNRTTGSGGAGGAVRVLGPSTFLGCTFSKNVSESSYGGAVFAQGTSSAPIEPRFENCTFSRNEANSGGAIAGSHADTELLHCTVVGNIADLNSPQAPGLGGGLATVSGNSANRFFLLINTIVADNEIRLSPNHPQQDLEGNSASYDTYGGNLIGIGTNFAASLNEPNDVFGSTAAPLPAGVGPLQFNGGFTPTQAPHAGSLAVNGGEGLPINIDQRGQTRPVPVTGSSDKGAVEFRVLNFNQWAALHLLDANDDDQQDDPDADGLQNLMEYYVGSDPMRPSPSPLRSRKNGNTLEMDYPVADHVATGTFQAVYSGSVRFVNWHQQPLIPTVLGREGNTILQRVAFPATTTTYFGRLGVSPTP
jgi:predicted outer membrane repeat protein